MGQSEAGKPLGLGKSKMTDTHLGAPEKGKLQVTQAFQGYFHRCKDTDKAPLGKVKGDLVSEDTA